MYSQDGNFWRRFRFYVDGGLDDDYDKNAGVQIENSYLHLLDPYFGTTSATLSSYKGVPCVFMKAFAADSDNPSPALMYADDIPVPNGDTLSVLSATPSCYMQMFQNCSSLTSSPDIGDPAVYEYDSDLSIMRLISWIGQDAFTSAFAGCPNLSSVNIGFVEWEHENVSAFTDFLKGAALTGQLYGPSALLCVETQASCVSRYIPAGWEISSYESI